MSEFANLQRRWPKILLGLALATAAGFLFSWLKTPLPWMIGPLVSLAIANLLGAGLDVVPYGRQVGQLHIGTGVGLYFTPPVLAALLGSAGWIFAGGITVMLIAATSGVILARVSGVDRTSCFFATVPGGAAEMAVMADRYGGSVPAVAIAQSVRVALLVLIIPALLTYTGLGTVDRTLAQPLHVFSATLFPVLMAITALGGLAFALLKLQNPWMMGPLMTAAALTALGFDLSSVPSPLMNAAQLFLGSALGARFERDFFLRHRFFIPFAIINATYLILTCAALAFALAWASGIPFGTLLVAVAPGGIAEMAITAQALNLGVAMVTAFQFIRIVLANFGAPFLFRAWQKFGGGPGGDAAAGGH